MLLDLDTAIWLAERWWLCLGLGAATLVLELSFFVIVFLPRLTWFYVFGALCFHSSIKLTMQINFFQYFGYIFWIFLDWPTLMRLTKPLRNAVLRVRGDGERVVAASRSPAAQAISEGAVIGNTRAARTFTLGMSTVLLSCILLHIESWPFTDYRVFRNRKHYSEASTFRVMRELRDGGEMEWLAREDSPSAPVALSKRFKRAYQADDIEYVSKLMGSVDKSLSDGARANTSKLVLMRRSVDVASGGEFVFINTPITERKIATAIGTP